jgi:hypothetical protein
VLTLPFPLRFLLAFDGKLLGQVLRIFIDTVATIGLPTCAPKLEPPSGPRNPVKRVAPMRSLPIRADLLRPDRVLRR